MIKYCFLRCILLTFLSIDLTKGINDQEKKLDCDQEDKLEKDNYGYQHKEDCKKDSKKDLEEKSEENYLKVMIKSCM